MSDQPNQPVSSPDSDGPTSKQAALLARRRLLQGGLGAAPVLLASAPRSVMAGGNCVPASSFASINASRPDLLHNCSGQKPDYWKQTWVQSQWPSPCAATGSLATKFGAACGSSDSFYADKTMLQVLQSSDADTTRGGLARYLCAAVLNANSGKTDSTVLGLSTIRNVWAEYVARGYYEPTAGIKWYLNSSVPSGSGGIMQWLKSTMPA